VDCPRRDRRIRARSRSYRYDHRHRTPRASRPAARRRPSAGGPGLGLPAAQEDRKYDAELRRQDREREDRLRREADEKWEQRRRDEQRQREDDDAQQQVAIEFLPGGPLSDADNAVITNDGITHRIIVTAAAAYPIKGVDAQIAHQANSGLGILSPGWSFERPATASGQARYTCFARVPPGTHGATSIVRFTDRNGILYYSYLGYTRRFGQNTDFIDAATQLDQWIRSGPKPDESAP
jgi:hypothetical protein